MSYRLKCTFSLGEWRIETPQQTQTKEEQMSSIHNAIASIQMKTDERKLTRSRLGGSSQLSGCSEWEQQNLQPNTDYACVMVPHSSDYRLATDEDRKGVLPKGYKWLNTALADMWVPGMLAGLGYESDMVYIIPKETEEATKKREKKAAIQAEIEAMENSLAELKSQLR